MPTATTTTTTPTSVLSLKASSKLQSSSSSLSSSAATLRSLYSRAARAFLQRDVALTHSLLSSAFTLLSPPASVLTTNDALASQRRKWDILRITFESTLYTSPPSAQDPEHLPPALRANLMLSPEPLIATLHSRSIQLFTPADAHQQPSSAFLPSQILVTLVLASLKLDTTVVGRGMIEDWLAKHGQEDIAGDPKGYAKVLELYCLHVLPRLQDWDYAEDFLTYERELQSDVRKQYTASLRHLRAEAAANAHAHAAIPADGLPSSSSVSSRSASPARSESSVSSSSTQTATPRAPRPAANGGVRSLTPLTPSQSPTPKPHEKAKGKARDRDWEGTHSPHSASSQSIASTATSRTVTPQSASRDRDRERARAKGKRPANGRGRGHLPAVATPPSSTRERSATPAASSTSASASSIPPTALRRASFADAADVSGPCAPSTLALLRASVRSVLQGASRAKVLAYVVLFVVVPLVSFALRVRRRSVRTNTGTGTVDAVRRRLRGAEAQGGVVSRVWAEVARAVIDTVRMAGRGLV